MFYDDFIRSHVGKGTDYDKAYSIQCVDLIKAYLHDGWGLNPGAWDNAHAYYDNFNNRPELTKHFTRIKNTPDLVPQKGDIVVWAKGSGFPYGHIAIATGEGTRYVGDGHRRNMRGSTEGKGLRNYKSIGIAIGKYNDTYYAVQIFSDKEPIKPTTEIKSNTYKKNQSFYIKPGYVTDIKKDGVQGVKDFKILISGTTKLPQSIITPIKTTDTFSRSGYVPVKISTLITPANSNILSISNGVVTPRSVGSTNIVIKDSIKQKELKTIKGTITGMSSTTKGLTGDQTIGGITYTFKNGTMIGKKNGWLYSNGKYSYFKDGKKLIGFYYFTSKEGEKTPHWSYFDKNGVLLTGWQWLGKGTNNPDGNKAKHMSYFGDNGWLRTRWQQMGKGTYNSFDENTNKHWSYFCDNGWLRTGWQQMGKGTNNSFDENTNKHWSYFGENGWLRTEWQQMGKGTANSFDENTNKHWSYFGGNGWLRTGKQTINNKMYTFNGNGWLTNPSKP